LGRGEEEKRKKVVVDAVREIWLCDGKVGKRQTQGYMQVGSITITWPIRKELRDSPEKPPDHFHFSVGRNPTARNAHHARVATYHARYPQPILVL
jgi:hypothetical protein